VPFLRVIRDKRGYETTYLMHWCREGSKQRSRILYVFRTPGGVRVGRDALDAEVLKEIEEQHPDIEFDWNAVFHNQQIIETTPEPRHSRKRPPGDVAEAPPPQQTSVVAPRFIVPAAIEGSTPDEQMAFLTTWYVAIREKIPQRSPEPARQDVLLALCERLNPAAWTDADQITTGLQNAADALQRLAHVFAKRRRRSKKRPTGKPAEPTEAAALTEPTEPTEHAEHAEPAEPTEPTEPTEPQ
jgi:hypothetical protein